MPADIAEMQPLRGLCVWNGELSSFGDRCPISTGPFCCTQQVKTEAESLTNATQAPLHTLRHMPIYSVLDLEG